MKPLKVGEKVAVYYSGIRIVGTVVIQVGDVVQVSTPGNDDSSWHRKQLRRIKKKGEPRRNDSPREPRHIWVNRYDHNLLLRGSYVYDSRRSADLCAKPDRTECVEFVEVMKDSGE